MINLNFIYSERVAPMFSGYEQQDAQEFLKAMLEGINNDLNRVRTKQSYRELKIDSKKTIQEVVIINLIIKKENHLI